MGHSSRLRYASRFSGKRSHSAQGIFEVDRGYNMGTGAMSTQVGFYIGTPGLSGSATQTVKLWTAPPRKCDVECPVVGESNVRNPEGSVHYMDKPGAERRVQRELLEGEAVIWVGLPFQGLVFHSFDRLTWVPGVFGSITGIVGLLVHSLAMTCFMLPGLCMLIGRPLFDSFLRRQEVCYALTSHRAIAAGDDYVESAALGSVGRIRATRSPAIRGACSVIWFGDLPEKGELVSPKAPDSIRCSVPSDWKGPAFVARICKTLIFVLPEAEARRVVELAEGIQRKSYELENRRVPGRNQASDAGEVGN